MGLIFVETEYDKLQNPSVLQIYYYLQSRRKEAEGGKCESVRNWPRSIFSNKADLNICQPCCMTHYFLNALDVFYLCVHWSVLFFLTVCHFLLNKLLLIFKLKYFSLSKISYSSPKQNIFFFCSSSICLPKYFIAIYWYVFVPKYKTISKASSVYHLFTGNILVECFPYIMYCLLSKITIMHKYTNTLCSWNIFHWWREKSPKVKCIICWMEIGQKAWLVDGKWAKRCFSR